MRNWDQQAQRGRHAADVGTRLNHVANQGAHQNRKQKPARIMLADHGEQAFPCNLAHLRTEIDGGIHHGQEGRDGPQERRPERGADSSVSSDGRRIVIGCARNQSQAEGAKSPARHGFGDTGPQALFLLGIFLRRSTGGIGSAAMGRRDAFSEAKALSPVAVSRCSCGENREGLLRFRRSSGSSRPQGVKTAHHKGHRGSQRKSDAEHHAAARS